jgi:hypothetical protein
MARRTPHVRSFQDLRREFGGTCLYSQRDDKWAAYRIKPSESRDIASAEA